jgi:hypothetical protein
VCKREEEEEANNIFLVSYIEFPALNSSPSLFGRLEEEKE